MTANMNTCGIILPSMVSDCLGINDLDLDLIDRARCASGGVTVPSYTIIVRYCRHFELSFYLFYCSASQVITSTVF